MHAIRRLALLALVLALGALALPAHAGPVDDAKAKGLVGERADGYLGVVDANAPADVKALVERVNSKRRTEYGEIAARTGASGAAVAARAGALLIERTPPGQYVMGTDGRWRKR